MDNGFGNIINTNKEMKVASSVVYKWIIPKYFSSLLSFVAFFFRIKNFKYFVSITIV